MPDLEVADNVTLLIKIPETLRENRATLRYLLVGLICYLPLLILGPYRESVPLFLLALLPAYFLLIFSYRVACRQLCGWRWILACSILLRLLFIPQTPSLSEDVYRYLWDGALLWHGQNPYPSAPEDLIEFQKLYPVLYKAMAHRTRTSIYPPAAQSLFLLSQSLWGPSVTGWKLLLLAFELMLFLILIRGFRVTPHRFCLWAFNPLIVLEFYSSAHVDLTAITLFLGALYFFTRPNLQKLSPVVLAAATLVKLYPAFALPLFFRKWWRHRCGIGMLLIYGITVAFPVLLLILLWQDGWDSIASFSAIFSTYRETWRFNSLPFFLLGDWRHSIQRYFEGFFLVVALLLALRQKESSAEDLSARIYFLLLSFYLIAHTVHPWYVSWVLMVYPLLGLRFLAGIYLSAASFLSYLAYWLEPAGERAWILWLEYLPFYVLFLRDAYSYHISGHDHPEILFEADTQRRN